MITRDFTEFKSIGIPITWFTCLAWNQCQCTFSCLFGTHSEGHSREGSGTPLQSSCLENPMDGGAWWAVVHGVTKNPPQLSDLPFTFHFHALEKEMAAHSSVLAWRIPGMGEPGGLLSMGSHRVRHDWSDLAAAAAAEGHSEKAVATHSSPLAWKLPGREEPGRLSSGGSHRVRHD